MTLWQSFTVLPLLLLRLTPGTHAQFFTQSIQTKTQNKLEQGKDVIILFTTKSSALPNYLTYLLRHEDLRISYHKGDSRIHGAQEKRKEQQGNSEDPNVVHARQLTVRLQKVKKHVSQPAPSGAFRCTAYSHSHTCLE